MIIVVIPHSGELDEMAERLPYSPGKPKCVMRVSWEYLTEAPVSKVFGSYCLKNFSCILEEGHTKRAVFEVQLLVNTVRKLWVPVVAGT